MARIVVVVMAAEMAATLVDSHIEGAKGRLKGNDVAQIHPLSLILLTHYTENGCSPIIMYHTSLSPASAFRKRILLLLNPTYLIPNDSTYWRQRQQGSLRKGALKHQTHLLPPSDHQCKCSIFSNLPPITKSSVRHYRVLAAPSAFMESIKVRREQPRDESTTNSSNGKEMANAFAIDSPKKKTEPASDKSKSRQAMDLMDLDIGQETMQPVLQFTTSSMERQPCHCDMEDSTSLDQTIETTDRASILSATREETPKTIQAVLHARESAPTPRREALRQGIYTRSELQSLRPASAAPKVTTGIAEKFAQQQNAFLIGEHVHKTRYHTAAFLTEEFEKLSISDKKAAKRTVINMLGTEKSKTISDKIPTEPAASNLASTETSRANTFGPAPFKGAILSLPAHLSNLTTTADHGAMARAQYSAGNENLLSTSSQEPLDDVNAAARPVRRNKINETGFIALAANRVNVAAGRKGEDPLLVAYKRGL